MSMIEPQRNDIMDSVLAIEVLPTTAPENAYFAEWNINGEDARFACWKAQLINLTALRDRGLTPLPAHAPLARHDASGTRFFEFTEELCIIADGWKDYEVLDTGDGEKLERWGEIILRRPDPQAIWPKQQIRHCGERADAHYHRSTRAAVNGSLLRRLPGKVADKLPRPALLRAPDQLQTHRTFPRAGGQLGLDERVLSKQRARRAAC